MALNTRRLTSLLAGFLLTSKYGIIIIMKKIIVKDDEDAEVNIFFNFLNNKEYPQHRNIIFSCFPELKEELDLQKGDEKSIIKKFIKIVRRDNKDNIKKSILFIKDEVKEKGEKTLEILANLMDYKWKNENIDYFLIPTILPFSPFGDNIFYYSIYKSLKGDTEFPKVLAVSAHEISHMILFDIIEKKNIKLSQELIYFIKELIAPILVYQDDFKDIFKKDIVGNYNVLEVYFEKDEKVIRAFDYFLEMFIKNRSEKKDFVIFLDDMISICKKIEPRIKEKRAFDNKYGTQIMKDQELLKKFREPIKLR